MIPWVSLLRNCKFWLVTYLTVNHLGCLQALAQIYVNEVCWPELFGLNAYVGMCACVFECTCMFLCASMCGNVRVNSNVSVN